MLGSTPDLLRLLAVPLLAWAALRDVETRRVPNVVWYPMVILGAVLLAVAAVEHLPPSTLTDRFFVFRVAISLGFVAPLSYAFWRLGGFGGADAKALIALSILFPTYPTYVVAGAFLPLTETTLGVFSLTILTNTVLVGLAYPAVLAVRNALAGDVAPVMFVGRRVSVEDLPRAHGRLFETGGGLSRGGLDLDALRMYLRWRGATLDDLREASIDHRDPASIGETCDPGDGAVDDPSVAGALRDTDESPSEGQRAVGSDGVPASSAEQCSAGRSRGQSTREDEASGSASGSERSERTDGGRDDPWGAEAFLDAVDGRAYGTTPESLRDGLAVVTAREEVWISPGIPFIVPMFVGLLVALTYGDLLFGLLRTIGFA